jgi:DNA-binding NtrC family response regulator
MIDSSDGDEGLRVLLVCPREYPSLCAESILKSQACSVWDCDDFREALAVAHQDPPHVVFCPAASPRSHGINLPLELQKRVRTRGIRVIVVRSPGDPDEALPPQTTAIPSNASPEELVQVLRRGLQSLPPSRSAARRETRTRTRIRRLAGDDVRPTA